RYREHIKGQDDRDYRTRWEIIDEFLSSCAQFDERGSGTLSEFLQELALTSDVDGWDAEVPAVSLMTCHSAKGLEFGHVFLIGLEEGILPHASALESDLEIEEERRLCYVAMTRARRSLTLTAAESRRIYGRQRGEAVSRFLGEIPAGLLRLIARGGPRRARASGPRVGLNEPESNRLKMGVRVRHARFGTGTIMYTSGSGKALRARIRFERGRSREFLVRAAPLEILEDEDT
ncbi:MAG TPA: ATP-binding domain-containing protein, partial [Candidatus Hydrogenedentes bacterium]|nr:ATP-binding domain-containing protein [Candidatus Hydrogenedentota bacterium]